MVGVGQLVLHERVAKEGPPKTPMSTRVTIESDIPCLVLVMPLPQHVEPHAPCRVIEVLDAEPPTVRPGIRKAVFPVVRRAVST